MGIGKDEISMLDPTSDGSNYGWPLNATQKSVGNSATNYNEVKASVGVSSNIEKALNTVTTSGAAGQDWSNNAVKGGGSKLGKPYDGNGAVPD